MQFLGICRITLITLVGVVLICLLGTVHLLACVALFGELPGPF